MFCGERVGPELLLSDENLKYKTDPTMRQQIVKVASTFFHVVKVAERGVFLCIREEAK